MIPAAASPGPNDEVSALIETLDQTERRLQFLLAGQVDTVTDRAGRTFVLRHAQEQLRDAEAARQAAILNALPAHLALLDADGVIVSVNQAWQTFAAANAIQGSGHGIGCNYLEICDLARGDGASEAHQVAAGIRSVLGGEAKTFSLEYPCHSPTQQRWYLLTVTPLQRDRPAGAVAMHLDITERKRTEAALQAGAAEFRALAEAMPQMVWITRADGWNTYFSQQWMDYTGLTLEESVGHGWIKPFHPEDQPRAQLAWQHATEAVAIYAIECRLRRADGVYHWWLMRGVPQKDAAGKVLKWFGTCTDIHDLKSAELKLADINRALYESDEKFRQLAGHVSDVFYVTSADLQEVHYASPAYEQVWGRSVESLYARPGQWTEGIVPEEREQAIAEFSRLAAGETGVSLEFRIARPDGAVRWISSRAFAVRDSAGNVSRITGIASDVTERKGAEEVVTKRGAELERFHRLSVGRELQMITLKQQLNELAKKVGQPLPYDLAFVGAAAVSGELDRKVGARTRELEDSALASLNMMEDAVGQRENAELAYAKLKHEEASLVLARDEALHAMGARSQFLANMSHEIRTPMNGVIGMTELLQGSALTPEQRDAVETIHYSAQSLLTIINDILDFSRIDAGALRMEMLDFELPAVVHQAVATCAEVASGKGIKLACRFDIQELPVLRGDPGRLRQVLLNLIGNAVKFTERGEVNISVTLERRSTSELAVRFSIRDTGMGISSEVQRRLFQSFMQSDSSMTRRHGGSGLGLAICKQLVGMMGGDIGVESELGKGATFWFTARFDIATVRLPAPAGPIPALAAIEIGEVMPLGPWRVLVAEDNPINQMVARNQLLRLGLRPVFVDNGRQAVDALLKEHFDLVFMDCQMPELDGYGATAEIRRLPHRGARPWIVAMTAHAMGGDRERCLAFGMDDYLAKPVTTQALREAMQRFAQTRPTEACASRP